MAIHRGAHAPLRSGQSRSKSGSDRDKEMPMAMLASDLEALIRDALQNARIRVDCYEGAYCSAEVIDESFRGMNRVQQQRAVYSALKGKMDGPDGAVHALALTTRAPD